MHIKKISFRVILFLSITLPFNGIWALPESFNLEYIKGIFDRATLKISSTSPDLIAFCVGAATVVGLCSVQLYKKIASFKEVRTLEKMSSDALFAHVNDIYNGQREYFKHEIEIIGMIDAEMLSGKSDADLASKKEYVALVQVFLHTLETKKLKTLFPLIEYMNAIDHAAKQLTLCRSVISKREIILLYPKEQNYNAEALSQDTSNLLEKYSNLQIEMQSLLEKLTAIKNFVASLKEYRIEKLLFQGKSSHSPFSHPFFHKKLYNSNAAQTRVYKKNKTFYPLIHNPIHNRLFWKPHTLRSNPGL